MHAMGLMMACKNFIVEFPLYALLVIAMVQSALAEIAAFVWLIMTGIVFPNTFSVHKC